MAKVERILGTREQLTFDAIIQFETDNFVGFWDYGRGHFLLMASDPDEFEAISLSADINDLTTLDDVVFELTEEHITDVYDESTFCIVKRDNL